MNVTATVLQTKAVKHLSEGQNSYAKVPFKCLGDSGSLFKPFLCSLTRRVSENSFFWGLQTFVIEKDNKKTVPESNFKSNYKILLMYRITW